MNRLTLRFSDDIERAFLDDYFHRSLTHVRRALILGIFLYASFGVLDIYLLHEPRFQIIDNSICHCLPVRVVNVSVYILQALQELYAAGS